jgi:hypothetical protein
MVQRVLEKQKGKWWHPFSEFEEENHDLIIQDSLLAWND